MTAMKSKVHSEMEILEKTDMLITRYFQEARHVEDIIGIKEDGEERDIWYKSVTDPTGEDVRKLCASMRRNAKDERVLFHYNGHGVPRPTQNGEIWVFNKNFTQYIPLSLYDLQICMEFPSIYVWDCSSAETIVNWFMRFAKDHEDDWHKNLLAHQETVASTSISGARISSHMTADQQAESLKFKRRPRFR
ncbi:hypothetical protein TELCIR_26005, partial [Teladorsagia circumcincta]